MSHSSKANNAANAKQGAFRPSVPREGLITTEGHPANEFDQGPEYRARAFPPGSAPASDTYTGDPGDNYNLNLNAEEEEENTYTSVADTFMGATSGDVNRGLGRPMQGQTNTEVRHNGAHGRKKQTSGLEDCGIERHFAEQRDLEREEAIVGGTCGDKVNRSSAEFINASGWQVI
ncbi:hypothetical protein N7447_003601 [Penicillium robsamsonii]|uniref:uncharacterized protein n=1 Tax=Penicillium robsamsonii TaxID=1792511 RepID=UPI002548FAF5|nr:uncharacterized protein N7447_003601 [Penicillium robsamsonii]KAJ5826838.1 hypothetical protein N7447_003601 [Penicillium robsamsonii]